jgi:3-oxoacyl-[acyl-carrier-protein] synthase-3
VAAIAGLGTFSPARVVTNRDFELTLDTSDQWIVERTGIRERRYAGPDETVSTMGEQAARSALARAGLAPEELDLIIVATATPDNLLPSTACNLQARLGANAAAAFDVGAACSGFIYGLTVAEGLIATGAFRRVLVVGGEKLTAITDQTDRSTAILFGDGAGAAVLTPARADGRGLLATYIRADGRLKELLHIPGGGTVQPMSEQVLRERTNYMKMAGREVFRHAVTNMVDACDEGLRRAEITAADLDLLVPHQANIRIIEATAKHAGLPLDKVMVNVDCYGNTSAASIPLALGQAEAEGRLRPGMIVMLVAFGAGFTWGSAVIRW